jgi:hypothetical protein
VEPDDAPLDDPDPPLVEPFDDPFDESVSLEESELLDESLSESVVESWSELLEESLAESLAPSESLAPDFDALGSLLPLATLATSASNSSASGLPIQLITPLVSTMKAQGMPFWPAGVIQEFHIERSPSTATV